MGVVLWLIAGGLAFGLSRPVGLARARWTRELTASIVAALALGALATALDFGGWNEPDWRAGLFTGFGCLTAIAVVRLVALTRPSVSGSASDGRPNR